MTQGIAAAWDACRRGRCGACRSQDTVLLCCGQAVAVVGGVLSGLEGGMASVTAAVCQPLSIIRPHSWLLAFFFFFFWSDSNYLTEHLCAT